MKIPAAALLFCVAALSQEVAAGSPLQRKRSGHDDERNGIRKLVSDTVLSGEDRALWDRILQDAGMSMMPTDPPVMPETPAPVPVAAPAPDPTMPPTDPMVTPEPTEAPVPDATPPPTGAPVPDSTPPPTGAPVPDPTAPPTGAPVPDPTAPPTGAPVPDPTAPPTGAPVPDPTAPPTAAPVPDPTAPPTGAPVPDPTAPPTAAPVPDPTAPPTAAPVPDPTAPPTAAPVPDPTPPPTPAPTAAPVPDPTPPPTPAPTAAPVPDPTPPPTDPPTAAPVPDPTPPPTDPPTAAPVPDPTPPPTPAPVPDPTPPPTVAPTLAPVPITPAPVVPPTPPPAPANNIRSIVQPVALQGGAEWADPASYQSKAITWLEADPGSATLSDARIQQRYALACMYYATFAVSNPYTVVEPRGWIDSSGWVTEADECTWYGLTCNENSEVFGMALDSNRLTGTLPAELTILASSLTEIDLYRNAFYNTGDEGNAWLGQMTSLRVLLYGQTNFEYNGIPPQISQLTNLEQYDCSFTLYFGPLVGSTFAPLQQLDYLVLSGNEYNTSIPIEIGQLPNLLFLYVQNAYVDGDLSFMQPMQSIIECWVDQNPGLGGTIPTFIGSLQTLQSFSITRSGFTGQIPSELGNLNNLVRLWFYDNMLTGTVPAELGNLFKLQTLEVSENLLTGSMPNDICLNVDPSGLLATLAADCGGLNTPVEIVCDCCTCCENCPPSLARRTANGEEEDPLLQFALP